MHFWGFKSKDICSLKTFYVHGNWKMKAMSHHCGLMTWYREKKDFSGILRKKRIYMTEEEGETHSMKVYRDERIRKCMA